ncbi:MAG: histidine phosphatase family protein, partial [Gammaproteobacteria bacterium]|nr:histidine phosphatase family protein [Gammaproteobacteria bacterium]
DALVPARRAWRGPGPGPGWGTRRALACAVILMLAGTCGAPPRAATAVDEQRVDTTGGALLARLRAGGLVLYFRHAATDWSQSDRVERAGDWRSCDPQRMRQLSAQGRADAIRVGEAMRTLAIPVHRVYASPYCRTVQTAELLGLGAPEQTADVMNLRVAEHFGGRAAIVTRARRLIGRMPEPDSPRARANVVIVAHGNVAREATPAYPGEAESLVLRPLGNARFELLGRLTPDAWQRLAEQYPAETGTAR